MNFQDDLCPHCGSLNSQGVSKILVATASAEHVAEQLCFCCDCNKHYVSLFVFSGNVPTEESTRFEEEEG